MCNVPDLDGGPAQARGVRVDGYWADDARVDETSEDQPEAERGRQLCREAGCPAGWRTHVEMYTANS